MNIAIGTQVRETEIDPDWQMNPGEIGIVVGRADDEMGVTPTAPDAGRFWMVRWSDGDFVQLDTEIEVVNENR